MTYKLTKTSQPADPYYGAVSLLLHGDNLLDSSVNPKTLTAYGDAAVSTAQSKFNGASLAFDGTEDFISTNTSADLRMGTDEFTIEFWFYPTSTANDQYLLTSATGTQAWSTMGFTFFTTGTGKIECKSSGGGSAKSVTDPSTNSFTVNAWNHVAAVKDVAAGRYYLYLNGVRNGGLTIAFSGNQLEPFTIDPYVTAGGFGTGWNFGSRFNGYIDDIRITKGVCRYTTATFTPPTQPFIGKPIVGNDLYHYATSLLLKGDGTNGSTTIVDNSFDPKTITVNGDAQISTAQSKFGGSSLKFDGTGDYLSLASSTDFSFSHDFTVEAWAYPTDITSDGSNSKYKAIFSLNVSGEWNSQGYGLVLSIGNLHYGLDNTDYNNGIIPINTWTHLAVTRSNGAIRIFVNGILDQTIDDSNSNVTFANGTGNIPAVGLFDQYLGFPRFYFTGYIQDLRITKGIARYTSNFTPPGPLPTF